MLRGLILALLCTSCAPSMTDDLIIEDIAKPVKTKYKVGECTYLVDPENNFKGRKDDAMRVEEITATHYIYRWWVDQGGWALDTNTRTYEVYERITKRLDKCPG